MLVLPKMPSSGTPLCSAESRPFDSPVAFANICDIIVRASTPFIRNEPRSRCSGQMKSSFRSAEAGADDDGFLADAGVDAAADLALLDEDAEALVERADQLEPVEHLQQLVRGELELGAFDGRHGRTGIIDAGTGDSE